LDIIQAKRAANTNTYRVECDITKSEEIIRQIEAGCGGG